MENFTGVWARKAATGGTSLKNNTPHEKRFPGFTTPPGEMV